jgi:hypothetical protein
MRFEFARPLAASLALACFAAPTLMAQQQAPAAPEKGSVKSLIAEAVAGYTQMKTILLATADKMPAENYSFKATPDIRTFGEMLMHVAQAQTSMCGAISGTPAGKMTAPTATSKDDVVAALKKSFDVCDAANASVNESNALDVSGSGFMRGSKLGNIEKNVAHDNEMYGQMVIYLRLKGIVPPSTAMRGRM